MRDGWPEGLAVAALHRIASIANIVTRLGDRVLPIDELIAETSARLSVPDPLPLIDGLLAATAKVHGLTLVTLNVADISRTGVSLLNPFSPYSAGAR